MLITSKVECEMFYRVRVNILLKYCVQCVEAHTHLQQAR